METSENVAAAGTAADGSISIIDDDNFNSFLETVLSNCDESTATPAITEVVEGGGTRTGDVSVGEGTQEAGLGIESAAKDTGITGMPLTEADFENLSSTGASSAALLHISTC